MKQDKKKFQIKDDDMIIWILAMYCKYEKKSF